MLALALSLPWMLHARATAAAATVPSEQLLLFTYATALWHQDPGDPASPLITSADLLARVLANGGEFARAAVGLSSHTLGARGVSAAVVGGLVLRLLLLGLAASWRAGPSLLDGFTVAYALLVLAYFTFDLRLLVPLLPAFYLYLLEGGRKAGELAARAFGWNDFSRAARTVITVALAVANATQAAAALHPERERLGASTAGEFWEDQRRLAQALALHTAPGAVLLADEAPVLALLSGRPTYTHRYRREEGLLERLPIDYVLLPPQPRPELLAEVEKRCERIADLPLSNRGRHVTLWRVER